jgi:hypothetical protein
MRHFRPMLVGLEHPVEAKQPLAREREKRDDDGQAE